MTTRTAPEVSDAELVEAPSARVLSLPVVLLALVAFVTGTGEFVAVGLVPQLADDLGTTIGAAGTTVTLYAVGMGVTGVPLALLLGGRRPRRLLVWLLVVYAASNLLNAFAPGLGLLLGGRFVSAAMQAVAIGVALAIATSLVAPESQGRAVSLVFGGLMSAMFLGAPVGTALGGALGWRSAFALLTVLAVSLAVAIRLVVPDVAAGTAERAEQLRLLVRRPVWQAMAVAVAVLTVTSIFFPYLGAFLDREAGLGAQGVSAGLAAFGVAGLVGNAVGGLLSERPMRWALPALTITAAVGLVVVALPSAAIAVVLAGIGLWAVTQMAVLPMVTTRVVAGGGAFAGTANVSAVNIGIALGGFAGAPLADSHLTSLPLVAAGGLLLIALGLLARTVVRRRRSAV